MKRIGLVLLISGFWLLVTGYYTYAQQEQIQILTYYPAPYGVYRHMAVGMAPTGENIVTPDPTADRPLVNIGLYTPDTGGTGLLQVGGPAPNQINVPYFGPQNSAFSIYGEIEGVSRLNAGLMGQAFGSTSNTFYIGGFGQAQQATTGNPDLTGSFLIGLVGMAGEGSNPQTLGGSIGVYGHSTAWAGVGVQGEIYDFGTTEKAGISGLCMRSNNNPLPGTVSGDGVRGQTDAPYDPGENAGVKGVSNALTGEPTNQTPAGAGVFGQGNKFGVVGQVIGTGLPDPLPTDAGVIGIGMHYGIYGICTPDENHYAGYFVGNVHVTGKIEMDEDDAIGPPEGTGKHVYPGGGGAIEPGGDVAELIQCDIDVTLADVVSIGPSKNKFIKSTAQNDMSVAGIISENPTLAFGNKKRYEENNPDSNYKYLALAGLVYCNADASYSEIKPGDLLTTSPTPGHAMKAKPIGEINGYPIYPQGCIVGKALEPLVEGKGKILVLVCLM